VSFYSSSLSSTTPALSYCSKFVATITRRNPIQRPSIVIKLAGNKRTVAIVHKQVSASILSFIHHFPLSPSYCLPIRQQDE
jgi:hypothetical protein